MHQDAWREEEARRRENIKEAKSRKGEEGGPLTFPACLEGRREGNLLDSNIIYTELGLLGRKGFVLQRETRWPGAGRPTHWARSGWPRLVASNHRPSDCNIHRRACSYVRKTHLRGHIDETIAKKSVVERRDTFSTGKGGGGRGHRR